MQSKNYDERQLLIRYKIGFQAFWIMLCLIGINGAIKEYYYNWAPPLIEALIIIYIPAIYFIIISIFKNAYLKRTERPLLIIILFGILMLLCLYIIISSINLGMFQLIENGQLSYNVSPVMMLLFSGSIFITLLIRRLFDR